MNTSKLKRFATEARNKLRQGVINRLGMLGFDEAGMPAVSPLLVSGGAVWKDKPCTVAFYNGFKALEEQIRRYGVGHVIEEAAYTWFNRLMAIRILTKNELCEPVLRYVGSTRTPLIVDEARQGNIPTMDEEDHVALMALLDDDTKTTEQFAMLITAFCHNTPLIAKCFGLASDYTDVLFPANILSENGFIDMLNTSDFITDEDYRSSELLGWLYQFYISEKKDQVFAKKGKYDADDIPAATQIFTPNWIVKYMVQNAILPQVEADEEFLEKAKYLVKPETVGTHGSCVRAQKVELEDLKVADLACGSGHILNECFDLLYDLYISEGYTRREAIECIFTKNLTGIDIDTRAKQLATFALMLKGCQRDASLVDASLMPHVYDMSGMPEESRELGSIQIFDDPGSDNPVIAALSTHYDAIVMNPPYMPTGKIEALKKYVTEHYPASKTDLFSVFMDVCIDRLKEGGKYGMINMQSWMFLSSFESLRKKIIEEQHIDSLIHLGPRTFDELSGEVVQNAAFVISKEKPRSPGLYYRLIDGKNCNAKREMFLAGENRYVVEDQKQFEKIPGVPIAYWVSARFIDLFKENRLSSEVITREGMATADNERFLRLWTEVSKFKFSKINPSSDKWYPYNKGGSYRKWYGNRDYIVDWANNGEAIRTNIDPLTGRIRSHNYNGEFAFKESITWNAISSGAPCMRYSEEGFLWDSKGASGFCNNNLSYYLGLLNSVVSRLILTVLSPTLDFKVGDIAIIPLIREKENIIHELSNNSISISKADWDAHETSWDFQQSPLITAMHDCRSNVADLDMLDEDEQAEIQRMLPHVYNSSMVEDCVNAYESKWERLFFKLHRNEEELNRQFIKIYGLEDELTPDVPFDEVTILQQGEISINPNPEVRSYPDGDKEITYKESPITFNHDVIIKQFISYAVGCMMGRYRLDRPGLAIAHPNETPEEVAEYEIPGTDEKFWIDDDGIIPLMPEDCGFHDNAANRMATFVRQVFGEETQTANLNYIEECLGKSIEQYFIKDFWKDHKKMYQNRPIYWLFASKKGAFQVLVYVHRMNVATVERIRSRYLLPYIDRLNKCIDDLKANESTLSTKQRNQLKTLRNQVAECEEYHNRLAVVAERGIVPDLDDGIIKNHALFGDVVTKLK